MNQSLEPFVHRKIVVLHEEATGFQAARALCEKQIGCVIVSDHLGNITGLITDRDLVCSMIAMNLSPDSPLIDLMTKTPVAVTEFASLSEAINLMEKHGFRRIPVLDDARPGHQKCVGIVTLDDLIAANAIDPKQASRIVQSQIRARNAPHLREKSEPTPETDDFLGAFADEAYLAKESARAVASFIMSAIARRLHYSAAVQFIMQTPREFHSELFALPPGPDRTIDGPYFITGVASHMRGSDEDAKSALRKFWAALADYSEEDKLNHTLAQLPNDIRKLFTRGEISGFKSQPISLH
ncbi:MAG: CBS domain-containing protein [Bdellovibrionales bacterium]